MEGNVITTQEIFAFEQTGVDARGRVKGRFRMVGVLPRFVERFKALSIPIPYDFFDPNRVMEIK